MTNLEYYRTFIAVADNKSMTKAAEQLLISQPAVTQTIKNLEGQLNGNLFYRNNRNLELTPEGKMLYDRISVFLKMVDDAENEFSQFSKLEKGEVRIGISTVLTKLLLIDKIKKFKEFYPGIKVTIENGLTSKLLENLGKGKLDFVIYNRDNTDDYNFDLQSLTNLEYSFIYNPQYFKCTNIIDCLNLPFVIQMEKSYTRETIENFFKSRSTKPNITVEVVSNELVMEFVAAGIGIGCVYSELAKRNHLIKEINCDAKPLGNRVYIAKPMNMTSTKAAKAFLDVILPKK